MIKIERTDAPGILLPIPGSGSKVYASYEVRQALSAMQYGKCCYCEKIVDLTSLFPEDENLVDGSNVEKHVEHFRPKGKEEYRDLTNDWRNLLLACSACNVNKGHKFDLDGHDNPLCIDPSDPNMDPEEHIELRKICLKPVPNSTAGTLKPKNGSVMGDWTITNIKLNESTSRHGRFQKIYEILKAILDYKFASPDPDERAHRVEGLRLKSSSKQEYAFVARELCRQFNIPV